MREAARIRGGTFVADLYRGGAARRILADERVAEAAQAARSRARVPAHESSGVPSTTHISVVDADGNAASLSASTGCGSGFFVPGTGIQLNNMLGEPDLNPPGRSARPGERLTSMMAPSVVLEGGRPRLVVGSAGSIRLRAAILQIVVNVVDHGLSAGEAIEAPRVHLEQDVLQLEGGTDPVAADLLEEQGYDVTRWAAGNLYFGGAAAVVGRNGGARGGRRPAPGRSGRGGRVTALVRRAAPGDAAALVELARAVGAEEEGWLITDGEWRTPSEERRYLRTVRRHPHAAVFVAEGDEGIVGRISLARDPHPASEHIADLGIMVAQGYRRQGIGRALMEAGETWAREVGVLKLELHVFPYNHAAIALYEQLGYEREGFRRRHYRRGSGFVDAILMAKQVG